jgi:hypothetical protein
MAHRGPSKIMKELPGQACPLAKCTSDTAIVLEKQDTSFPSLMHYHLSEGRCQGHYARPTAFNPALQTAFAEAQLSGTDTCGKKLLLCMTVEGSINLLPVNMAIEQQGT